MSPDAPKLLAGPPPSAASRRADSLAAEIAASLTGAPLLTAWVDAVASAGPSFTIPGHKRRAGAIWPTLGRLLDADVPLYGGLDTPKLESGQLAAAETIAAQAWGVNWCRFSTGGSTHANQVFALAVGRPGDTVLVSRNVHRSTLLGLMLAGLHPVWLPVDFDERYGITTGVSAARVQVALAQHPDAVAVFLVEPGYTGTVSAELPQIIGLAHRAGAAVVVDQAWGAHFGFHPAYPPHALQLGADAMVMSAHKTLPAFSQAAFALAGDWFAPDWLDRCFEASATTSPSGAILASLDASRALLTHRAGFELLDQLAAVVERARLQFRSAGFDVPGPDDFGPRCFDPAKLVVQMGSTGLDGLALEHALREEGIAVEMSDRSTIVPIVGLFDDDRTVNTLVEVLLAETASADDHPHTPSTSTWSMRETDPPPPAMSPREAFYAPRRAVPLADAVGEICAEVVAPYPPGVPVLVPGEPITAAGLQTLRLAMAAGSRIAYAADATLQTILVVTRR